LKSNDKEKYDLLEKILNDKFYINYNELEKITTPEKYSSREFVGLVFKNI
jgi:hypothetical protein